MYIDLQQRSRDRFHRAARQLRDSPGDAFWNGFAGGSLGIASGVAMLAKEASSVRRGEVVPTALGRTTGLVSFAALAGGTSATLAATMGMSAAFAGPLACIAALYPAYQVGKSVSHGVRALTDYAKEFRRLQFGGYYSDTATAERLRMQAIYEMSGATQPGRRYLGQEAYFQHR